MKTKLSKVFQASVFLTICTLTATTLTSCEHSVAQKSNQYTMKFGDPMPANAFTELAKLVNPAVVNISTTIMPKRPSRNRGQIRDPFFDMLEEFYGMQAPQQQARPSQALGTGFIIRDDGLIVTNNHVIQGADVIKVQLSEKSNKLYEAKLIGADERTDLALIKIKVDEKLPTVQLGNSKDLEVGEWVAAFGNPFGQGHTMTKGIISAKGREIGEINRFPMIQTDTPINPGNSGGPLVNLKGQVIGVNSAIDARAQGIGFAIPIDEVKAIIPQLEKNGHIQRGYIGVALDDLNPQAAMYLGLKDTNGSIIVSVDPNGPAGRGGVKPYDVIIEFNGKKIENTRDLMDAVADATLNSVAKVRAIREGKIKNLEITVGLKTENKNKIVNENRKQYFGQKLPFDMGLSISDMNDQIKKEYNINAELGTHPVITNVETQSKAEVAGFLAGDVILEVNKQNVINSQDVNKHLQKGTNTFRIARGEGFAILMIDNK